MQIGAKYSQMKFHMASNIMMRALRRDGNSSSEEVGQQLHIVTPPISDTKRGEAAAADLCMATSLGAV